MVTMSKRPRLLAALAVIAASAAACAKDAPEPLELETLTEAIAIDSVVTYVPQEALVAAEPPLLVRLELEPDDACEDSTPGDAPGVAPPVRAMLLTERGERLEVRPSSGSATCERIDLVAPLPRDPERRITRVEVATTRPLRVARIRWRHGGMRIHRPDPSPNVLTEAP